MMVLIGNLRSSWSHAAVVDMAPIAPLPSTPLDLVAAQLLISAITPMIQKVIVAP